MIYSLGVKAGPDPRKHMFSKLQVPGDLSRQTLEENISHRVLYNSIENQGRVGTCVAFGVGQVLEAFYRKANNKQIDISKSAIYSLAKHNFEPQDMKDDGLYVSDGLRVVQLLGYVLEQDLPYVDTEQAVLTPVDTRLLKTDFEVKSFLAIPIDARSIKYALRAAGPIIMAVQFPRSWEKPGPDGKLSSDISNPIGGHCMNIMEDINGEITIRNQWGTGWGDGGYGYVDMPTLLQVLTDAYTVTF